MGFQRARGELFRGDGLSRKAGAWIAAEWSVLNSFNCSKKNAALSRWKKTAEMKTAALKRRAERCEGDIPRQTARRRTSFDLWSSPAKSGVKQKMNPQHEDQADYQHHTEEDHEARNGTHQHFPYSKTDKEHTAVGLAPGRVQGSSM